MIIDVDFLRLLRQKLAIPGAGAVDVSAERLEQLRRQLDAELRPVLREREFIGFDLDRAMAIVRGVAQAVEISAD